MAGIGTEVTFKTPGISTRNELGHFTSVGLRELYDRNTRMMDSLRADLGRRIENNLKRPGQSSGNLVRASAHHENAKRTAFYVGIGVESWLNARAKYWRTIEEGSAAVWRRPFIGTQLGPSRKGRTSANLVTALNQEPRADGRFVVRHEIAPLHVYRTVYQNAHLDEFGVQSARRFFERIYSEAALRVR